MCFDKEKPMINFSSDLKEMYPNLKVGVLIMNHVQNIRNHEDLNTVKSSIEEHIFVLSGV